MFLVGVVGIGVNVAGGAILFRARGESLNVEAAFRHVLADLLGLLGVVVAAVVILATGWLEDPIASVLIGLLVLASSWTILRLDVDLLESRPGSTRMRVGERLAGAPGVVEVRPPHLDDHVRVPGAVRTRPRRAGRTATDGGASRGAPRRVRDRAHDAPGRPRLGSRRARRDRAVRLGRSTAAPRSVPLRRRRARRSRPRA